MNPEQIFVKLILVTYDPENTKPDMLYIMNFDHIIEDEEKYKIELPIGFSATIFLSNGTDYFVDKVKEKEWSWSVLIQWSASEMELGNSRTFEGTFGELLEEILIDENSRQNDIQKL